MYRGAGAYGHDGHVLPSPPPPTFYPKVPPPPTFYSHLMAVIGRLRNSLNRSIIIQHNETHIVILILV